MACSTCLTWSKILNSQREQSNDVEDIKENPKLLIPADKANNLYELTTKEYDKLLIENISKMYKKKLPHLLQML